MESELVGKIIRNNHPFELLMDEGKCSQEMLQRWVANRYIFQKTMIAKDAMVIYKCPDREFRRMWMKRIYEADAVDGGLESWIKLGHACGIDVTNESLVYPSVRLAMNAFLHWCEHADWKVIVASSLSQLKAVANHTKKFNTWYNLYPWIEANGLDYFLQRIGQVEEDSQMCLTFIQNQNIDPNAIAAALQMKRDVMKALLDAVYMDTLKK
jgi:pyrroloquinoline-quinone synthase